MTDPRDDTVRDLMDDRITLDAAYARLNDDRRKGSAPTAIVEAVMYGLRNYGVTQFEKQNCQHRLAGLKPEQLRSVIARLIRLRPQYPNISDELLLRLEDRLP